MTRRRLQVNSHLHLRDVLTRLGGLAAGWKHITRRSVRGTATATGGCGPSRDLTATRIGPLRIHCDGRDQANDADARGALPSEVAKSSAKSCTYTRACSASPDVVRQTET